MANWSARDRVPVVGLSRRRLLSTLAVATSAALLNPIQSGPRPVAAQTPVATPGTMVPNTLAPDASPRFRAVAEALMAAMTATATPGAALGILADGREEHATFGVDRIEGGVPVTPDTLFQIGSITKTFTGTAVMRLVDEGALDLDATVRTYLPDFRLENEDVAARVTLRHLLTHTGGWWGDLFVDTGDGDDAIARYVERWMPTLPQQTPLAVYVNYNNSGFTLLGRVIEVATGEKYRALLQATVLDPLGLTSSFFAPDEVMARSHAYGHFTEHGSTRNQEPLFLPPAVDPAGGLWATTADLIRYARFHLGDGTAASERIVQPETLELMQTAQQAIPGQPGLAIGLPWFVADLLGQHVVQHDGGTYGQYAQLWLAPEQGFAFTLLTNALPGGALAAQAPLIEAFIQYLGVDRALFEQATPAATPAPVALTPPDLEQYAGRYVTPDSTSELRVEDGALVLIYELHPLPEQVRPALITDVPPRIPVELIAEDLALVTIGDLPTPIAFVRDDDGDIGWVAVSARLIPKVESA